MKTIYKEKIGSYSVIKFIANATVDTEQTKQKVASVITPEMSEKDIEKLYAENLVYAKVGREADLINDVLAEQIRIKLDRMKEHQLLSDDGGYIADYRDVEYWIKKSGAWKKSKIEEIGVPLPDEAVLQEQLTAEQQKEISDQQEAERIGSLTEKEKAEEKGKRINALAREVNQKADDAELLEEAFDKKAWFKSKKAEIEKRYA